MNPSISINIPCYNRKDMLKECIESFIAQTYEDWELVLIDDGSEEDLTFASDMDKRVKYFRVEHSGILARLFNHALFKSSGKYIMPFGSDDLASDPTLLEKEVAILESMPQYSVVCCDYWKMHSDGSRLRVKYRGFDSSDKEKFYDWMLKGQTMSHGATLWRQEKMPSYDEEFSPADDWEVLLKAAERGLQFYHIPERLWTYRVGHSRYSGTKEMAEGCKKILIKRGVIK